ncbi:sigma 54-interacting transcriptional regulator [uncultured Fusobacterium sp.]|uniref:sigma-54-dependent Fis family transcriptional regulator n=1 Tax=uncultured Fusobacterium sp. TaxID=159267 RepID=UPI0025D345BB|nr:sigma 54-interacting transcriptional regulator [uncultured Fusobacterium sp.]
MMILKRIQNYIKQYIEVISNILQCEVEIVDENLIRIAGTGYFEKILEKKLEGSIYPNVFLTEESHIIVNPRENKLCKNCKSKENCKEELEISTPIFYKGQVIGVIGLVCFKKEDKNRLLTNIELYLKFIEQISELISSKLFEVEEEVEKRERVDIFKKIIDNYDKGIIILDENGKILDINNKAIDELKINDISMITYPKLNIIPKREKLNENNTYLIELNNNRIIVYGNIIKLKSLTNKEYKIFLFELLNKNNIKLNLNKEIDKKINLNDIIGNNNKIVEIKDMIKKVSDSLSTILIVGESGTGKELVARAIHSNSLRSNFPFVAINCGAIPESLLESELFGYVRGAFSGAINEGRAGKFELANNGTIFLDEIGDMPLSLQVKLLRVLQEKKIERLGSNKSIDLNIRIIAATNANLEEMIVEKKFRKDLYYRLNVLQIELPPLRERKEDIILILEYLIKKYSLIFDKNPLKIDEDLKKIFINYNWPGNIRELENIVEYLVNMQDEDGNIEPKIKEKLREKLSLKKIKEKRDMNVNNLTTLEDMEKEMIKKVLNKYGISKVGKNLCAKELGIGIATLYRKIEKYKL